MDLDKKKELENFYSSTLNLPKTSFKMKANLAQKEPITLRDWKKNNIYEKSLKEKNINNLFFLHDGPPYANGGLHIGHAINKILKDIILKYKRQKGFYAPYIPGWDTHGLPIEWKIIQELGEKAKDMTALDIRKRCHKYALKWVEKQKEEFIRLGILGDWENPYITLKPEFEAEELRVFKEIYENGYIYKGLKPVYWSPTTETALAEAEIEYKDITSSTIYVGMQLDIDALEKLELNEKEYVDLVIWTTTPWTLPANLAISLNKEFEYGIYEIDNKKIIIAIELAEKVFKEFKITNYNLTKKFKGELLENTHYFHPLFERKGIIILGDHVTLDAGTGAVHTAPGHGIDDYLVGQKYNLPILSPVDDKGHLTHEAYQYEGLFYLKANKIIIEDLEKLNKLYAKNEILHSYPHDWRSKKPVIYRATEQWFINVSESDIRKNALEIIDKINFVPEWGRNRIRSMMETRPDWTISRQRVWGVPIPIIYNRITNEVIYHSEIMDRMISLVEKEGTDIWWKYTEKEIIGEELLKKYNLENIELRKEKSILDVWFDSGSSHRSVIVPRGFSRPADLYLEGSDQHRGWFQSSLLTSVASTKDSPYKEIFTHGFVMDGQGRKMSKSLGNGITPEEVINEYGADVLRLWAASVDYRDDVRISQNILQQISESYRKIRNTARYMLGNIYDFDINNKVDYNDMLEIDKWAMNTLEKFKQNISKHYEKYEFYNVYQEILYFCSVNMSSFYLDIIKDRLYCEDKNGLKRRSAQTVLTEIIDTLVKVLAPILSFTAEEIYEKLPDNLKTYESVHLTEWPIINEIYINEELDKKWSLINTLRKEVNKKIEIKRQENLVGLSLDAKVRFNIKNEKYKFLEEYSMWDLSDIFLVSQVEFTNDKLEETIIDNLYIEVIHATGEKCLRSWRYDDNLSKDEKIPHVTLRDYNVVKNILENEEKND